MLISVGERISCALVAMAISDLGTDAVSLTGSQAGIVTDTAHGSEDRRGEGTPDPPSARRRPDRSRGGGSRRLDGVRRDHTRARRLDTTAVALAAALGADACEIYTDVDGVFTADPRVVPAAQKLHAVSYEEMLELAARARRCLRYARSSSRGTTA